VTIALLLGTVGGLVASILSGIGGPFSVTAVRHGAVAFAGTVSLTLAVMAAAGAL
jgi:hypothetical protein